MAQQEVNEKPLEKMTAKELRDKAMSIEGIAGVHGMNKPELLAAVKEAMGIEDEDGKNVDTGAIRRIKAEIKGLQAKREAMRKDADRKQLNIMRKKISRLKKETRRLAVG